MLSLDEKTQIQALDRTQPMLPLRPGQVERHTHDYERHGTTSLFAALEVGTGRVTTEARARHTGSDFLAFLRRVERAYPAGALHVVLDNVSTHKTPAVRAWLEERPRITFHFTPTSASWMNQVETWFSVLTRQAIRRGAFRSVKVGTTLLGALERLDPPAQLFEAADRRRVPGARIALDRLVAPAPRLTAGAVRLEPPERVEHDAVELGQSLGDRFRVVVHPPTLPDARWCGP